MVMLRSLLFNIAFYINTAIFVIGGSFLLFGRRRWAMAGLANHARVSLWLLRHIAGMKIEVRGRDKVPPGAVLIASKHQSAWDTFALIPLFRDPAVVMKAGLGWIPFYGWFSHKFEHIFVKRQRGPAALKALIGDARDRAAAGREIVLFPEGTRRIPGAPPTYKPGVVALYEALGLPCVPLALNSGLYWPRRQFMRYPGTIVVEFLDAIPPGLDRKTFKAELQHRLETASNRLIEEARRSAEPPPVASKPARVTIVQN